MEFFKQWFGSENEGDVLVNKGPVDTADQPKAEDYMQNVTGDEMGVVSKEEIERAKNNN
jgi:hypothetical protein